MMIQRKAGATKKRARSSSNNNIRIPGLPNWGSFAFGLIIGIALTTFVYFKFGNQAVTLTIPTNQSQAALTEDIIAEVEMTDVVAANEPQFDFYTELTKNSQSDNKPMVLDLKSKQTPINVYLVQAGSFKNRTEAEALKAELTLNGVTSKVETAKLSSGEVWYRVVTGRFNNEAAALAQQRSLKAIAKIDGTLVQRSAN